MKVRLELLETVTGHEYWERSDAPVQTREGTAEAAPTVGRNFYLHNVDTPLLTSTVQSVKEFPDGWGFRTRNSTYRVTVLP